jgi:hypothetical protein
MIGKDKQLTADARSAVVTAVAAAFPFVGQGEASRTLLDAAAARAIDSVLTAAISRPDLAVVACEGKRDGAWTVPTSNEDCCAAYAYCDPIDGTLSASRGGPRSFSVLALGFRPPSWHCRLDDTFSVFTIGSREDELNGLFEADEDWASYLSYVIADPAIQKATLNRLDNMRLLHDMGGPPIDAFETGSQNGYRPTLRAPGVIAVGDATVTLAFECQVEFGRMGLVEAEIESVLYRSWAGLLVSRDRIRGLNGGLAEYLHRYLSARQSADLAALSALFTEFELACIGSLGIDLMTATRPLNRTSFGAGFAGLAVIAALCSDHDPRLYDDSATLEGPQWIPADDVLRVDTITASADWAEREYQFITPRESPHLDEEIRRWYAGRGRRAAPQHDKEGPQ